MIPATVSRGGEIVALGRRFWAPDLASKAGWEVELHFDQDDEVYPSVWTKGRAHRLCTAALIADGGFLDFDRVRGAAKLQRDEQASIVRRKAEILIEVIDHRLERAVLLNKPFSGRGMTLAIGKLVNAIRHFGVKSPKFSEHGHLEVAKDSDLELKLAASIFQHGDTLFGGHDLSSANSSSEPNPADPATHRLSETSK